MASAASVRRNDFAKALRVTVTDVTMDTSYPTGGESITAADLGLKSVFFAIANLQTTATTAANDAWYDVTNSKLKVNGPTAEVANGASLASVVITVYAWGY